MGVEITNYETFSCNADTTRCGSVKETPADVHYLLWVVGGDYTPDPCEDIRMKLFVATHIHDDYATTGMATLTIARTDNELEPNPLAPKGTRCRLDDEWHDIAGWPVPLTLHLCDTTKPESCYVYTVPASRDHDVFRATIYAPEILRVPTPAADRAIPAQTFRVTHDSWDQQALVLNKVGALLRLLNPGYRHVEYALEDIEAVAEALPGIGPDVARAIRGVQAIAYKVDIFRLGILYVHGGVYLDSKILPLRPLDALLPAKGGFFPRDIDPRAIWNGLMAFPAGDPLPVEAMQRIYENIAKRHYGWSALEATGPLLVGRAHDTVKERGHNTYKDDCNLSTMGVFIMDKATRYPSVLVHNAEYRRRFTLSNVCHYTELFKSRAVYYEARCDPRYGLPWNTRLGVWDVRVRVISGIAFAVFVAITAIVFIFWRRESLRKRHVRSD